MASLWNILTDSVTYCLKVKSNVFRNLLFCVLLWNKFNVYHNSIARLPSPIVVIAFSVPLSLWKFKLPGYHREVARRL